MSASAARVLYLSSAGNEAMEARMVLGSVRTLGQHSISMRKRILLACCDLFGPRCSQVAVSNQICSRAVTSQGTFERDVDQSSMKTASPLNWPSKSRRAPAHCMCKPL